MNYTTKAYAKKIASFFVFLILISSTSFAQKLDKGSNRGQRLEIGVSLNTPEPSYPVGPIKGDEPFLDGGQYKNRTIAIGIIGKYFLNTDSNKAIRLRFVFTDKNIKDHRELYAGGINSTYDIHYIQRFYKISPGFQWTVMKNRISFFGGIEIPVTVIGKNKQNSLSKDESDDKLFLNQSDNHVIVDGGFSAGLGFFFGSNYFFTKNIGVGFDLSAGYLYTAVGGKIAVNDKASGSIENIEREMEWDDSIKEYKFSPIQAGINLTFKF
jgi:hypothetical protein